MAEKGFGTIANTQYTLKHTWVSTHNEETYFSAVSIHTMQPLA